MSRVFTSIPVGFAGHGQGSLDTRFEAVASIETFLAWRADCICAGTVSDPSVTAEKRSMPRKSFARLIEQVLHLRRRRRQGVETRIASLPTMNTAEEDRRPLRHAGHLRVVI
jgi:hypothetical protein